MAAYRRDFEAELPGLGEEIGITHGLVEGLAEGAEPVVGRLWRGGEGAPESLASEDELHQRTLAVIPGLFEDGRYVRKFGAAMQAHEQQHIQLVVAHPFGSRGLDRGPGPATSSVHFTAIDGERDFVAAGIACDDADLRAEQIAGDGGECIGVGATALAAHSELVAEHIFIGADAGEARRGADADFVRGAADPAKLPGIEHGLAAANQRLHGHAARESAEISAVLWRDIEQIVRHGQAAGAGHVLRHDGGIARHVPAHETRQRAGVDVISTARRVADEQGDGFPSIKVSGCGCAGGEGEPAGQAHQQEGPGTGSCHDCLRPGDALPSRGDAAYLSARDHCRLSRTMQKLGQFL